jgi:hypothetical protein
MTISGSFWHSQRKPSLCFLGYCPHHNMATSYRHGNSRQSTNENIIETHRNSPKKYAVKTFLDKMAKEHGQHQPDKAETHLPQGMTKLDVYDKFIDELPEFEPLRFKVSESFWYRTWRMHCPHLKCPKICKFSECKICSTAKLHKQVAPAEMKGAPSNPFIL